MLRSLLEKIVIIHEEQACLGMMLVGKISSYTCTKMTAGTQSDAFSLPEVRQNQAETAWSGERQEEHKCKSATVVVVLVGDTRNELQLPDKHPSAGA